MQAIDRLLVHVTLLMEKERAGALVDEQRGGDKGGLLELAGAGGVREQRGSSPSTSRCGPWQEPPARARDCQSSVSSGKVAEHPQ